jgi:hypothetical protein
MIASATYTENLKISISLNLIGSGESTTVISGGFNGSVVVISNTAASVILSGLTIRNGRVAGSGGGIVNSGTLRIVTSTVTGNTASATRYCVLSCFIVGGGIYNSGTLTIDNSSVIGNAASTVPYSNPHDGAGGGGILNGGTLTVNNSTLSGNSVNANAVGKGYGGGILNYGKLAVNNTTFSGNTTTGINAGGSGGGGIYLNGGAATIANSTISGNGTRGGIPGGGVYNNNGTMTLQNSIVADSSFGGNCYGGITSKGYNLSSDNTCSFNGPGDLNNIDPRVGGLGNYGGATQTIPLLSGSPAIDAGNPSGCTDSQGILLKTDQRGMPRPDREDKAGCDMGAYESQSD